MSSGQHNAAVTCSPLGKPVTPDIIFQALIVSETSFFSFPLSLSLPLPTQPHAPASALLYLKVLHRLCCRAIKFF